MRILKYGNPILRKKAEVIEKFDSSLSLLAEEMVKTMQNNAGIGLAANQIGEPIRMFVAKLNEKIYTAINPQVLPLSGTIIAEEGCLSIPEVWLDIERYEKVKLKAQDLKGKMFELELEGVDARVVQHELDHLNGILIIDRIPVEKRKEIDVKLKMIAKEEENIQKFSLKEGKL